MAELQSISFRTGQPSDLLHFEQIDEQRKNAARRLRLEQATLERRCWVAVHGETVGELPVAFGLIDFDWFGHQFVELLVVHPKHRRRGIGRSLLRHLRAIAGDGKLFTSTKESNTAMQRLLENEGFVRSGVNHNLDRGDPELIFVHRGVPK